MEKTVVVLSGKGKLPSIFKHLAEQKGYKVYTVGVRTITDFKTDYRIPFLGFFEFEQLLEELGKPPVVMLGKFEPKLVVSLFDSLLEKLKLRLFGGNWKKNWEIFLHLRKQIQTALPGEVIKTYINYLEGKGFNFLPSEEIKTILSPLLAGKGILTSEVEIDSKLFHQGKKFFEYTKRLADMEIGQTLVFKGGQVFAVEAADGTDATIKRAAKLSGKGFSVVKAARSYQDYRIDIPTVGLDTLKILKRYKAKALFLESEKVLIVEKERFLKEASKSGIAVIGLTPH